MWPVTRHRSSKRTQSVLERMKNDIGSRFLVTLSGILLVIRLRRNAPFYVDVNEVGLI